MSGFPKLIPAFTAQIHIDDPLTTPVGSLSAGSSLVQLPFVPNSGFLRSEPDYPVTVDAVFVHGADYIKVDPDGKFARLEVQSALKSADGSGSLRYNYTGVVDLSKPGGKVLRGEANAATTDFGGVYGQPVFETGTEALKALEGKTFVQSGRFIIEAGKPTVVEYKISEVVN